MTFDHGAERAARSVAVAERSGSCTVSLIVPVFNESGSIDAFLDEGTRALGGRPDLSIEYVFVDDGSTDDTIVRLLDAQRRHGGVRIVELTRNFGKEAAISAGMEAATGDVVVPIDVDLQDPPALVLEMIERWREGADVVLARRVDRANDTVAKRTLARWFYRVHNALSEPEIPENVGDFRAMDRAVVEALRGLPESRRFMKGLFAWVGFRTASIDYRRPPRAHGGSRFNTWRLWNLALEGITSFSTVPLRVWTYVGGAIALAAFAWAAFLVVRVLVLGIDVPGYASLFVAVAFLGGLQLLGIGIIGEYLGRVYVEAKRRPAYLIRRIHERRDDSKRPTPDAVPPTGTQRAGGVAL